MKEILFGQRGVGNYTGIQTELLQDAAKGSLVPIFRRFNQAKTKLGNKLFWLVQNRMTSERTLTFVNPDDGPEAIRVAINLPNPESAGTIENNVTEGEWKYYVREISGVPFSKTAEAKQKLEAAKVLQPLDPVEAAVKAIDAIDLPGKQKDIVRIRERGEQMMKGKSEAEQAKMRLEISKLQLKQEDLRIRQYEVQKGLQIEEVETGSDVALNEADGRLKAAQTAKTLAEAAVVEPKSASKGEA